MESKNIIYGKREGIRYFAIKAPDYDKRSIYTMEVEPIHIEDYKDVLNFKELKTILRKGRNQTYALLRDGTIPSKRVGRDYRILKSNVINYLQNYN